MAAAKSQKERNDIQEYWISVDREQEAALINKIENEYLSFIHSETLTNSNNSEFAWTKDDLGKSVTQNVLSEVGNQPWVGYVYYAENASKFTRTVAKSGGPVAIGFLIKDFYTDYQMYSVRELAKAWGANLIPVATGLGWRTFRKWCWPCRVFCCWCYWCNILAITLKMKLNLI